MVTILEREREGGEREREILPGSSEPSGQSQKLSLIRSLLNKLDPSLHFIISEAKYLASAIK